MKLINSVEELGELDLFLESNIVNKIGTTVIDNTSYFEVDSIRGEKLLINKIVLDAEIFIKVMNSFIKSRKMLLDQDYKKVNYYCLDTEQGEAKIEIKGCKCEATLFASVSDENILVPTDNEFLSTLLGLIDNGCDPQLIAKSNDEFYLTFGPNLTIKFNRVLLKYIEDYVVNCKYNKKYMMKMERKK